MFKWARVDPTYNEFFMDTDKFLNMDDDSRRRKTANCTDIPQTGVIRLSPTRAIVDGGRMHGSKAAMDWALGVGEWGKKK